MDAYATGKADGGIAEYVMQVYNFAQSNPWPDAWYEKCREELLLTEQRRAGADGVDAVPFA